MTNTKMDPEYYPTPEDPIRDALLQRGSNAVEVTWTEIDHAFELTPHYEFISFDWIREESSGLMMNERSS